MVRFDLVPGACEVFVRARTNVNTVTMATTDVVGHLDADTTPAGVFLAITVPWCRIELPVASLHSSNPLYDWEGRRHFDADRYPLIAAELVRAIPAGAGRHAVTWRLTFHGTARDLDCTLVARAIDEDSILVEGESGFDVRDWGVQPGGLLAIRVHPEASFAVHLLAHRHAPRREALEELGKTHSTRYEER